MEIQNEGVYKNITKEAAEPRIKSAFLKERSKTNAQKTILKIANLI